MSIEAEVTRSVLMYFVLPLWLLAGFADYLCHRASRIATTAGPKESLIHLLMLTEMAVPVTAAMALEVNALVILVMICLWAVHEATAVWDVFYAYSKREITPIEQWPQFLALFGLGSVSPRFEIAWKEPPLPWDYVLSIIAAVMLLEVLPYLEELVRGLLANHGRLVPRKAAGPQPD
jgi:hypothetical protein